MTLLNTKLMTNFETKDKMLKKLVDLCLDCIGKNLHVITNIHNDLPTKLKEVLIERLGFHDKFTPEYLPHIAEQLFCAALKKINFYECTQIDDAVLLKLADCKCQLQSLSIDGCLNVTDHGLQALLQYQTQLQTLEIISLPEVTGSCLKDLHSSEFQYLIFQEQYGTRPGIDNEALCSFIDNNKSLFFVCIHKASSSKPLTENQISKIITNLGQQLILLYVTGNTEISDRNLTELAEKCPNLRTLKIRKLDEYSWSNVSENGLRNLFNGCKQLSEISLSYYHELFLNQHGRCALPELPKSLEDITLDGSLSGVDEEVLYETLTQLPLLQKLDTNLDGISAELIDRILAKNGHQFKDLRLMCSSAICTTMHSVMASVAKYCINLNSLTVYTCEHMDGRVLYPLLQDETRAAKLKHLKLWPLGNLMYDVLLAVVNSCLNLQTLTLANHNLDDDFVLALSKNCQNLSSLDLNGQCPDVSEDALCKLAMRCPLSLARFPRMVHITDKLVKTMAYHCPCLVFLRFSGEAGISPEAIKMLRENCVKRVYIAYHPKIE
ncbi:uncharacterized protein LOC144453677 [Glandiceps talaboti]